MGAQVCPYVWKEKKVINIKIVFLIKMRPNGLAIGAVRILEEVFVYRDKCLLENLHY